MRIWPVSSKQLPRTAAICLASLLLLTACAEDERREIRLTPTSTVETGVRILVDNCPGPTAVQLLVRDDLLWQIDSPGIPDELETGANEVSDQAVVNTQEPGLAEFLVGQEPEGWSTSTPLDGQLSPGIRYTIRTEPDGQTVDFSTPDLAAGLLWDGQGNAQFNPNLINVECSEPADVGAFAQNIVVLILLGVTAAATVIVAIILILFVITRRFSRIRSIQKQASAATTPPPTQRPRARSKN